MGKYGNDVQMSAKESSPSLCRVLPSLSRRQNIDGIATLTNDPLALDNINKFKVGDRVMCNDNGVIGTVKKLDIPNEACVVDFDNGEEDVWIENFQLPKE